MFWIISNIFFVCLAIGGIIYHFLKHKGPDAGAMAIWAMVFVVNVVALCINIDNMRRKDEVKTVVSTELRRSLAIETRTLPLVDTVISML